jgi:hypothetical protein
MNASTTIDDAGVEWGPYAELKRRFGIGRTTAYYLYREGKIKSRVLRRKGCAYGTRLFSIPSAREFMNGLPEQPTAEFVREMKRRARLSAQARAAKNGAAMK